MQGGLKPWKWNEKTNQQVINKSQPIKQSSDLNEGNTRILNWHVMGRVECFGHHNAWAMGPRRSLCYAQHHTPGRPSHPTQTTMHTKPAFPPLEHDHCVLLWASGGSGSTAALTNGSTSIHTSPAVPTAPHRQEVPTRYLAKFLPSISLQAGPYAGDDWYPAVLQLLPVRRFVMLYLVLHLLILPQKLRSNAMALLLSLLHSEEPMTSTKLTRGGTVVPRKAAGRHLPGRQLKEGSLSHTLTWQHLESTSSSSWSGVWCQREASHLVSWHLRMTAVIEEIMTSGDFERLSVPWSSLLSNARTSLGWVSARLDCGRHNHLGLQSASGLCARLRVSRDGRWSQCDLDWKETTEMIQARGTSQRNDVVLTTPWKGLRGV